MNRPERLPLPTGYSSRPASEADVGSIYRVIHDYDVGMAGFSDFAPDDLFELFREEHLDIERDTCVVLDREGDAAAYTMLWASEPQRRYLAFAVVHPEHVGRGIGSHLLGFLERRMREHVAGDGEAVLHNWVDRADEAARRIVEAAGFSEVRRHYTMGVDLSGQSVEPSVPERIAIRRCTEGDARAIHTLLEDAFAEHWGFTPISYEQWRRQSYERSDTDLSMWFFALEGDEPVGILIGRPMDGLGWVADLGVKKTHRRRGIASALLGHSFADFQRRGYSKVGLGVDVSNETQAVRVYENVGMRPERVYVTYEKLYRG